MAEQEFLDEKRKALFYEVVAAANKTRELMRELNSISNYSISAVVCSTLEGVSVIDNEVIYPVTFVAARKPAFLSDGHKSDIAFYRVDGEGFAYKYTWEV